MESATSSIQQAAAAAAGGAPAAAGAAAAAEEADAGGEADWKVQAEEFKASGNDAFKAGKWLEAVDWYTKAIGLEPEDRVYYSNRSAAYLKLGDAKSKALKDAEKCMELGFDWPKAYSRLGAAQHALRRYEAALETFQVTYELYQTAVVAWLRYKTAVVDFVHPYNCMCAVLAERAVARAKQSSTERWPCCC
jgi:tetratricopeptide (TPR) repeat protein